MRPEKKNNTNIRTQTRKWRGRWVAELYKECRGGLCPILYALEHARHIFYTDRMKLKIYNRLHTSLPILLFHCKSKQQAGWHHDVKAHTNLQKVQTTKYPVSSSLPVLPEPRTQNSEHPPVLKVIIHPVTCHSPRSKLETLTPTVLRITKHRLHKGGCNASY